MKCQLCNEIRGIQGCHIISRFFDNGFKYFYADFNKLNKLYLCPNHHWYFDNALLTSEEFKQIESKVQEVTSLFFKLIELRQAKFKENNMEIMNLNEEVKLWERIIKRNKTLQDYVHISVKENDCKPITSQEILN